MGLREVQVRISNPQDRTRTRELTFVVDSGAIFSVIPREILESLGVAPEGVEQVHLSDLTPIERKSADLAFTYGGRTQVSPVMFGEDGDATLLGVVTVESLGYVVDPVRQELRPMAPPPKSS